MNGSTIGTVKMVESEDTFFMDDWDNENKENGVCPLVKIKIEKVKTKHRNFDSYLF